MKLTDPYCRTIDGASIVILTEPGGPALVVMPEGYLEVRRMSGVRGHHDYQPDLVNPRQAITVEALYRAGLLPQ